MSRRLLNPIQLLLLLLCSAVLLGFAMPPGDSSTGIVSQADSNIELPPYTQENSDLTSGLGVKAHWNLTEVIGSTSNSFDSVAFDVNDDGELEVIVSKNGQCEFYCLKQDGEILWHTPLLSSHSPGYYGSEIIDLEGDGRLEFVTVADSIWVFDVLTGEQNWVVPDIGNEPDEVPWVLGHVSSSQYWNIVTARTVDTIFLISVYDWTGSLVWSTPVDNATYGHTLSVEDVDGDGYDEVFVACSRKTVAFDHDGSTLWVAPLTPLVTGLTLASMNSPDLLFSASPTVVQVDGWWYHSDFVEVSDLYGDDRFYVLQDYGGGILNPTVIQVLDGLTGEVVDSFGSSGHHQWLKTADLRSDFSGKEVIYVTREKVVVRDSQLNLIWEKDLSGAHEFGIGDWDGDGVDDILVSTVFRGLKRFANVDSNFVVYNATGDVIYNMRYAYSSDVGKYTAVQMQTAMKKMSDYDGDGHVDVPLCFSSHDLGKFGSSHDVHQYIMSWTDIDYKNEFHEFGNDGTYVFSETMLTGDALQLGYLMPSGEYVDEDSTALLLHMNEGSGKTVVDSSSCHNDGTLYSGSWIEEGKFGTAVQFNGENTVLAVPYTASLDFDVVAVEVWLNAATPLDEVTQSIVERPGSFGLELTSDGYLRFFIRDTTAIQWSIIEVKAPLTEYDRFIHVIGIYDGLFLRLIVNGKEVAVESHNGQLDKSDPGAWGMFIGDNRSRLQPFHGVIDELRISSAVPRLPIESSGRWISEPIFMRPGTRFSTMSFDSMLNGGQISLNLVDLAGEVIVGHTNIFSSPHALSDLAGPVRIQIDLVGGDDIFLSPSVNSLQITFSDNYYFPLIIRRD